MIFFPLRGDLQNKITKEKIRLSELIPQTSPISSRADENRQTPKRVSQAPYFSPLDRWVSSCCKTLDILSNIYFIQFFFSHFERWYFFWECKYYNYECKSIEKFIMAFRFLSLCIWVEPNGNSILVFLHKGFGKLE